MSVIFYCSLHNKYEQSTLRHLTLPIFTSKPPSEINLRVETVNNRETGTTKRI